MFFVDTVSFEAFVKAESNKGIHVCFQPDYYAVFLFTVPVVGDCPRW